MDGRRLGLVVGCDVGRLEGFSDGTLVSFAKNSKNTNVGQEKTKTHRKKVTNNRY